MTNETTGDLLIIGFSNNVEAEYGQSADAEYTVLQLYNDEPVAIMGFNTKEAALAEAADFEGELVKLFTRIDPWAELEENWTNYGQDEAA